MQKSVGERCCWVSVRSYLRGWWRGLAWRAAAANQQSWTAVTGPCV